MTATTEATATTPSGSGPASATVAAAQTVETSSIETLIPPTLLRLTDGLPIHELNLMVTEATECEAALLAEIALLEKALTDDSMDQAETASVDHMLNTEFAPPDRFYTISSLMGRLREPLAVPLPPTSSRRALQLHGKRKTDAHTLDRYQTLLALEAHPEYNRKHNDPTRLVAAWKRVSSHRTAAVFRRSVNPKEAPGYTDRILFPIDLQLIRKMISASIIQSYSDLHHHLLLICHNCVKFNGRESDYGIVTRDFEAQVEEVLLQLVMNPAPTTTARTTSPMPPAVSQPAQPPAVPAQPTSDSAAPQPPTATPATAGSTTASATTLPSAVGEPAAIPVVDPVAAATTPVSAAPLEIVTPTLETNQDPLE